MRTRYIIGCMTGTSLDGLDAALVRVDGQGRDIQTKLVALTTVPLGRLRGELNRFARGMPAIPMQFLKASRQLGELHAQAVTQLIEQQPDVALDFVVAHGQTIWHAPQENLSWQLFDPWPIVRQHRLPVLYDLRQADLIAGGQGAPITPMADRILFPPRGRARLIVNLGGICNVTFLPADEADEIHGFDLGPCNLLIDGVVRDLYPEKTFDNDGRIARMGSASDVMFNLMVKHPFFEVCPNRSTGREEFNDDWLEQLVADASEYLSKQDMVTSAVEAVALMLQPLVKQLNHPQVVLAGGGAKNPVLVDRIRKATTPSSVVLAEALGVPVEAREAMGIAALGALTHDGVAITLPQVTGSKKPGLAGVWANRI